MAVTLHDSLLKLEKYIVSNGYRGYDPFDALTSPFFTLPWLKTNKLLRFGAQQILKRLPVNIRPLLMIKRGYNPVTLGLVLQAFAYLQETILAEKSFYKIQGEFLMNELIRLQSRQYSGACWGYDFDWEARYAKIGAYVPTVVATGIITNALFVKYEITGNQEAFDLCRRAIDFLLKDLQRTCEGDTFCFSYSPLDHQVVFNATAKGARLLAQVYSITKDPELIRGAENTLRFVAKQQTPEGSWAYAKGDSRAWVDNFHTGYILDCLHEYRRLSKDFQFDEQLRKGIAFYVNSFFGNKGEPKYYNNSLYPIDATSAAQSILTLVRFGYVDLAIKVANWMIANMQDEKGYFYYQKHEYYINRISYMRWSNAWMFVALSYLFLKLNSKADEKHEG